MRRVGLLAIAVVMLGVPHAAAQSEDYIREQIGQLRSRSERDRIAACRALYQMGVRALPAAPHLARVVVSDRSAEARGEALDVLRRIGPPAIGTAVELLLQRDPSGRRAGAGLLTWWEDKLTEADLRPCLADLVHALDHPECRGTCAALLESRGGVEAVEPLLLLLGNRDAETRAAASRALAGPGRYDLASVRKRLEEDRRSEVRAGVAEALGRMGEKAAGCVDALVIALEDASDDVAAQAATALGRIGERPAVVVPRILEHFAATSPAVREACLGAAARFGADALPFLRDLLVAEQPNVRAAACETYGRIGRPAGAALVADLAAPEPARRAAALDALRAVVGSVPAPEWIDAVEPILEQEDRAVLVAAARVAGACGRHAVNLLRPLLRLAESEMPEVRAAALIAVGDLAACFDLQFEGEYLASQFAPVDGMRERIAECAKSSDAAVRAAAVVAQAALDGPTPESLQRLTGLLGQGGDGALAALERLEHYGLAAAPALPAVVEAGKSEDPRVRCASMRVVERVARSCGAHVEGREARTRKLPRATRDALERAFGWLSAYQDSDGMWDSDEWMKHDDRTGTGPGGYLYDPGVTGLALLAMMGVGVGPSDDERTLTIRRGLRWLMRAQIEDGVYGSRQSQHFMVVHAVATLAVAEGAVVFRDEALLDSCRRGAAFLEDARNPELAWRYAPRGGENDTHCTTWVVAALVAAEQAGAPVDRACFDGARAWLDRMSSDGRVGYNFPGGLGARQEEMVESHPPDLVEPMTAAGLWAFTLMGGCDEASALTDTILACPPRWSSPKGTIDLCYWFFGAQALHAVQAKGAGGWLDKLTDALVPMQAKNGSWDPVGAWGLDGGRVYSTAMGALALLATVRTDPDALGGRRPDKQVREALGLLLAAESDPDPRVAHAAWTALNAIPGARK